MADRIAADASQAAVQAQVNAAVDGDNVLIPNGSATWTTGISTNKQIIIRAQNYTATRAGRLGSPVNASATPWVPGTMTRNVVITNNCALGTAVIQMQSGNSFHCGVGGIRFNETASGGTSTRGPHVRFIGSGSKPPLLFDCAFQIAHRAGQSSVDQNGIVFSQVLGGVMWNCVASGEGFNASVAQTGPGPQQGLMVIKQDGVRDQLTPSTIGMLDVGGLVNVYMEDCSLFMATLVAPDVDAESRFVMRNCWIDGSTAITHGFGGGASFGPGRHVEIYDNRFFNSVGSGHPVAVAAGSSFGRGVVRCFWLRGGTALFVDNEVNNAASPGDFGNLGLLDIGENAAPQGPYPLNFGPGRGYNGTSHVSDPIYIWNQSGPRGYTQSFNTDPGGWESHCVLNRDMFISGAAPTANYLTATGAKPSTPGSPGAYQKYTYPHPLRAAIDDGGPGPGPTQLWDGVLAPARATDWSAAGVTGGIPNRTTIATTLNPGATVAQINSAIAAAPANSVVLLNAGTYNLSGAIAIQRSDVTLRGAGMSTILNFTSTGSFFWGSVCLYAQSASFAGGATAPSVAGVPASTIRGFTGTNGQAGVYTQGATVLNLASVPTGLAVGMTLTLWQADAPDATLPSSGYFVSDKTGASGAISWQGTADSFDSGHQQRVRVTAINGSAVTIAAPGLHHPTGAWTTARTPQAGWQTGQLSGVGIEDLRITRTATGIRHMVALNNVHDSWIQRCGISAGTNAVDQAVHIFESRNVTIRQNWWTLMQGPGVFNTTGYGIRLSQVSSSLIESNIFQSVESPIMLNIGTVGTVLAYNLETTPTGEGGLQCHEEGPAMNLFEGNSATKLWADFFHGNTNLNTVFRSHHFTRGIDLSSYNRWWNAVGNVIVATTYQSIATTAPHFSRFDPVAFRLGYPQQNADPATTNGVAADPVTITSFMRWGNYATVNGVRFVAAEVPTTDPVFPAILPASQTLPPSFYYAARPTWWPATKAWPPIGPDITNGNISGLAGHAHTLPAQDCFTAASGNIANYTPITFYSGAASSPPAAPTNLRVS